MGDWIESVLRRTATSLQKIDWLGLFVVASGASAIVWFGGHAKDPTLLGEVLAFCIVLFAVLRFPDVSKLKAFGVEVERAKELTNQAMATAEQLRTVASTLGRITLDTAALAGRFGSDQSCSEKKRIRDDVVAALKAAVSFDPEISAATRLLDRSIGFDLAMRVIQLAAQFPGYEIIQHRFNDTRCLDRHGSLLPGNEIFTVADAATLAKLLDDGRIDDARVRRRLQEYTRYEAKGIVPNTAGDAEEEAEIRRAREGS